MNAVQSYFQAALYRKSKMADFIAVLQRAVDGLSSNTPIMRARVYEKARAAVVRQLGDMLPPPPDYMLRRQLSKLDAAIREVEYQYDQSEVGSFVSWDDPFDTDDEEPAPSIPDEQLGPTFAATDDGRIKIASSSPASPRDLDELGAIIGALVEAVDELIAFSSQSNAHNNIADLAKSYREAIKPPVGELAVDLMYVRGIRLQNTAQRLEMSSRAGDLPDMALRLAEALDTVVALHGLAVMSTETGRKLVEKARSYNARPDELEDVQRLGTALVLALEHEDVLEARTATEMKALAADVVGGFDSRLSSQAFLQTASGLLVWCGKAALWGVGVIAADGLLHSQIGAAGAVITQHLLDKVMRFLLAEAPTLMQMSALAAADLQWLPNVLRVVKARQIDTIVTDAVEKVIDR